jgi:hypothetical protein
MIQRGSGQIVNVSSMSAFLPAFGGGAYGTAKAALLSMSENLRIEVAHLGIGVTCVCPGITRTPMLERAQQQGGGVEKIGFAQAPEKTALKILAGIKHNKGLVLPSPDARIGYFLKRFFPGLVYRLGLLSVKQNAERPAD